MKSWKARLLVGFMLVAMMLVTVAGPALANHTNRHENRIDNRQDRHHNGWNGWNNHHDNDWNRWNNNHNNNDFDFDEEVVFFTPFLFVIEDIDCDGFDDDFDGWIDEDAVCEVEFGLVDFFDFFD
jgi:Ni/Co efflux regulator RcnB